jgi:ubiquinone/menaquinone biosynthesis C-methylase UbiE
MVLEPDDFYTKGAEDFAKNHRLEDRPGVKESLNSFCERIEGLKVLDVGCGSVEEPTVFVEKGFDYTGIDIAPGMIEYAREHRKGEFHVTDMKNMDFDDNTFHGIWCNASIFFVPVEGMTEALNEFKRVLKTPGVLYVNFKLGEGSFVKEKYGEEIRQYLISKEKAMKILESSGFEIEDSSRVDLPNSTLGEFSCRLQK